LNDPTLALARELMARNSVTPADGGCMDLIARRLAPLGFTCEFINRGGVTNLWARRGTAKPLFCSAGRPSKSLVALFTRSWRNFSIFSSAEIGTSGG